MQFTSATYRLKVGVPATVEHAGSHHQSVADTTTGITNQVNAKHIAETVEVRNPMILFASLFAFIFPTSWTLFLLL